MNKEAILSFLDKATDAVKVVAPYAGMLGVSFVEKIAGWADTAVDIAQNAVARADEAKVVLTSTDVSEINAKIAALQATNDQLADYIANS